MVIGKRGHEPLKQPFEVFALRRIEHTHQLAKLGRALGEQARSGLVPGGRQVQRGRPAVRAATPLEQPVRCKSIGELDRRWLRDAEHLGKHTDGLAGMGVQVHECRRVGSAATERPLDRATKAVSRRKRDNTQELRKTITHCPNI